MVNIDKAIIARLEVNDKTFEILVDAEKALEFKKGTTSVSVQNILAVNEIFKDARKGDKASPSDIQKAFKTTDVFEAAGQIIRKGDIKITTHMRQQLVEEKRKQLVNLITRNAINPQTNTPHPPQRIEACLEQARVQIDPFIPAEEQMAGALKELRPLIPIRIEKKRVAIKFPAQCSQIAVGIMKRSAEIKRDAWLNDGSWVVEVEIPAGTLGDLISTVNRVSQGNATLKELESLK